MRNEEKLKTHLYDIRVTFGNQLLEYSSSFLENLENPRLAIINF